MTQSEAIPFANMTIAVIKNRQTSLECCQNDITRNIRRLDAVILPVLEENWQKEFKDLKCKFLSCCEGGCFTNNWKPFYFLFEVGDGDSPKSHPKVTKFIDFCAKMSNLLSVQIVPFAGFKSDDVENNS